MKGKTNDSLVKVRRILSSPLYYFMSNFKSCHLSSQMHETIQIVGLSHACKRNLGMTWRNLIKVILRERFGFMLISVSSYTILEWARIIWPLIQLGAEETYNLTWWKRVLGYAIFTSLRVDKWKTSWLFKRE